ncbi:ead/Ea22-like family protein [Salmonella enterica]|uniref:ead/Ea22-like family protein n=1 Tax=Salmonella enterica TaxID=28901 RepID=UPI0009B0EBDB|nr:ead/Ea22-like family protein [Salmonella enterica]EDA9019369.1 ead/Ea22-like family protein [Salmonella enterica subsp. enterica serovar Shubra]EDV9274356.1 ead/Ea22-like family protein [Salmonella enterica subsp. enterica serovar Poona]EED9680364.1 ead/Ea22-like family protein [Salmonella enterica subsp. enterica serovar Typhimurium]HAK8757609.1 ead/Ea22-like family protein [Salmonella enterica]
MTINKQALREVAEKATPGTWCRSSSQFNGITVTPFSLCGEEVMLAHTVEKRDAEFIAAAMRIGAAFNEYLTFPNQVESTAG